MIFESFSNNPREYMFSHAELIILGIVTMTFIVITIFLSIKFLIKYINTKDKHLLFAGIAYVGVASCWFGVGLNFISVMLFNEIPPMELHFLLHGGIVTIAQWCFIMLCTDLSHLKKGMKKLIQILTGIIAIIVEIIYIFIVFTNSTLLGYLYVPIQVIYGPFSYVYLGVHLILFVLQGIWLGRESMKSEDNRIRLKGKLIVISFLFFLGASILEVFFSLILIFIIARVLVTISAISFYSAFILPKWIEKLFLKEE